MSTRLVSPLSILVLATGLTLLAACNHLQTSLWNNLMRKRLRVFEENVLFLSEALRQSAKAAVSRIASLSQGGSIRGVIVSRSVQFCPVMPATARTPPVVDGSARLN